MTITSFIVPHIRVLMGSFDIRVMANTSDANLLSKYDIDIPMEKLPLLRTISPFSDAKVFFLLLAAIKRSRLSAVHTITPKSGLIGMATAYLARVPIRVHSFTGQVWVTRRGFFRLILKLADKCIAALATDILVDSPSQRDFLISEGILNPSRSWVLGAGSICGVDTNRFCPSSAIRSTVRHELSTSEDTIVCLFLGRLVPDKGILDLARAFACISHRHSNTELWIVGPDEAGLFEQVQDICAKLSGQVKRLGSTSRPERYMQAADLFCLPSYREGFGSAVIEAAACCLPALASRIYGLTDAIVEGKTGWMHEAGNVIDLASVLDEVLSNPYELLVRGIAARRYAVEHFDEIRITSAMATFYETRLHEAHF
jgi:glycosyltransferase involved in cell wall biosynthesis